MSSADLWDDLAAYAEVPAFRLRRLRAVAWRVPRGAAVLDIGIGWGEIIPMLRERGVMVSPNSASSTWQDDPALA